LQDGRSLNPRTQRQLFAKGNRITYQVYSGGDFVTPNWGALRILEVPNPPTPDNLKVEISVSTKFKLCDKATPPENASEVELGTYTPRTAVINAFASRAGLNGLVEDVPEYPINYPLWQSGNGFVAMIGQLLFTTQRIGWMDANENIRAKQISTLPPVADFSLVIQEDGNEVLYSELREGSEDPPEIVRVSCNGKEVITQEEPEPEYAIAWASTYSLLGVGSVDDQQIAETSVTKYVDTFTQQPRVIRRSRRPRGVMFPAAYPLDLTLADASQEITTTIYETNSDGKKLQEITRQYLPTVVVQPDQPDFNLRPSSRIDVFFNYVREAIASIGTYTLEQNGVVNKDAAIGDIFKLVLSTTQIEFWRRRTKQTYSKTTSVASYKIADQYTSATTSTSSGGNNTPPATDRKLQQIDMDDVLISGVAEFPAQPGAEFMERDREFDFSDGVIVSAGQAIATARVIGVKLHGLNQACLWGMPLLDDWITNYEPLKTIDVTVRGVKSRYWSTATTIAINKEKAVVTGKGIFLGVVISYVLPTEQTFVLLPSQQYTLPDTTVVTVTGDTPQTVTLPAGTTIELLEPGYNQADPISGLDVEVGSFGSVPNATNYETEMSGFDAEVGTFSDEFSTGFDQEIGTFVEQPITGFEFEMGELGGVLVEMTLATNAIAAYNFNSDFLDLIGSNDLSESASGAGSVTFTTGKVGNAILFDGDRGLEAPDSADLRMGNSPFTVVFIAQIGAHGPLVNKAAIDDGGWYYEYEILTQYADEQDKVVFRLRTTSSNYSIQVAIDPPVGDIYLIAAYNDPSNAVDGLGIFARNFTGGTIYQNTNAGISDLLSDAYPLRVGVNASDQFAPNGNWIDALTIYKDRILSSDDLSEIYNLGDGREYPYT
jgi:hypothetical protein